MLICVTRFQKTEAFDLIFQKVLEKLDDLENEFQIDEALKVARQIGFFRFVSHGVMAGLKPFATGGIENRA